MPHRLCPKIPLPPYAFIPGKFPHPEKPGGHMFGEKKFHIEKLDPHHWQNNETYLYALDLMNHQYFWEAHVWLEDLWNQVNRVGPMADFFKALILICAAQIKFQLKQMDSGLGHLKRSQELLESIQLVHKAHILLGLDLAFILDSVKQAQRELLPPQLILIPTT